LARVVAEKGEVLWRDELLGRSFDSALRAPLRMTAVWEKMTVAVGSQDDGKGEPRAIH